MNSNNTVNETILIQSLKRNNCENILGRTGLVWKSILEAMAIASQSETKSGKLYTEDTTNEYDTKQQITQHNLNNIISDEFGNRISNTYLNKILAISTSEDDFLNKVNFHITIYGTPVSEKNNNLIRKYYKENKSTGPKEDEWNWKDSGKTLKEITLDHVELNGPLSSTEIRKFMYEMTHSGEIYDPVEHRGWYSSYFSDSWNAPAHFSRPSRNGNRILTKTESGKYTIKIV